MKLAQVFQKLLKSMKHFGTNHNVVRSYTMKLYEEFKLWENMWDQPLTEDSMVNMVELRRGIKSEIARLKAEKAEDTDPTSAYYYDEEIAACEAELAELERKYPITDAGKKRKQAADMAALASKINDKLYFTRLSFKKFGRPKYEQVKGKGWFVVVRRALSKEDIAELEIACASKGLAVKYNSAIELLGSKPHTLTLFDLDLDKLELD